MILFYLFDLKDIGKQADALRSMLLVLGMIAGGVVVWLRWGRTRLRDSIRHWSYVQSVLAEERGRMEAGIRQEYAERFERQEGSLNLLRRSVEDMEERITVLTRSLELVRNERGEIAAKLAEHEQRLAVIQAERDDCQERVTIVEQESVAIRDDLNASARTIEELREANRVLAVTLATFTNQQSRETH